MCLENGKLCVRKNPNDRRMIDKPGTREFVKSLKMFDLHVASLFNTKNPFILIFTHHSRENRNNIVSCYIIHLFPINWDKIIMKPL